MVSALILQSNRPLSAENTHFPVSLNGTNSHSQYGTSIILLIKATILVSVFYYLFQARLLQRSNALKSEKFQAVPFLIIFSGGILFRFDLSVNMDPWRLINNVLRHPADKRIHPFRFTVIRKQRFMAKLLKWFFVVLQVSCLLAIFTPTLLALLFPCQFPLVLGSLLLEPSECHSFLASHSTLFKRALIVVAESFVYSNVIIGGSIYGMYCLFLQIILFWTEVSRTLTPHRSKVGLLQEYRNLQVRGNIFNSIIKCR